MAHASDALRLALVYKYSGWYADIDTVTMKPLTDFKDGTHFISSDQKNIYMFEVNECRATFYLAETWLSRANLFLQEDSNFLGRELANGYFGALVSQSPFLWRAMEYFIQTYNGKQWSTGGATPLTKALYDQCDIQTPPKYLSSKYYK